MPQLSPLNWALLSIFVLVLVFFVKVFYTFMTFSKLKFLNYKMKFPYKGFLKWNW